MNKYAVTLKQERIRGLFDLYTYYIEDNTAQEAKETALSYYDMYGTAKVVAVAKIHE